jgi:hypothetical protein
LHTHRQVHLRASLLVAAILGALALCWAFSAATHAEVVTEGDPNDYLCTGHISAGTPEVGNPEQQVSYSFSCDGVITGYQLEAQVPLTGFEAASFGTSLSVPSIADAFSCGGDVPGYAVNCVGAAKAPFETIAGQFAIGKKLCAEPRVDPLLTVTDIYLEKGVPTQAISGPFDLGRPLHCPADGYKGGSRLEPATPKAKANKHKKGKGKTKKAKAKKK